MINTINNLKRRFNTARLIFLAYGLKVFLWQIVYKFLFNKSYVYYHDLTFQTWTKTVEKKQIQRLLQAKGTRIKTTTKISIVMPVYNVDPKYLNLAVRSIIGQVYQNWELCVHDDASTNEETVNYLKELQKENNPKIRISFGKTNGHISHATNEALKLATGDYVMFMDNDDEVPSHAILAIVSEIYKQEMPEIIYYDEDLISETGIRRSPIFKPDWAPETILSIMYLAHATYRKDIIDKLGGMQVGYEGSQDYDLVLRASEISEKIVHIPKILYHWRQLETSTAGKGYSQKNYARESAIKALKDAIDRRELSAELKSGLTEPSYRVKYKVVQDQNKVSIIIPTRNMYGYLKRCIDSIESKTDYSNYEIIIVNNGSDDPETIDYLEKLSGRHTVVDYPHEFNYPKINNFGVEHATGDHILLLNNDTEVIAEEWLKSMVEFSQQKDIGVVGAKLLFEDGTIQHAGCVVGIGGYAAHVFRGFEEDQGDVLGQPRIIHNVSAVTGACMMTKKSIYKKIGGLDERFKVAVNDIDFCLRVVKAGFRNVYTPFAKLYHYESKSRGYDEKDRKKKIRLKKEVNEFRDRWNDFLDEGDPFYNENLSLIYDDFSISLKGI